MIRALVLQSNAGTNDGNVNGVLHSNGKPGGRDCVGPIIRMTGHNHAMSVVSASCSGQPFARARNTSK